MALKACNLPGNFILNNCPSRTDPQQQSASDQGNISKRNISFFLALCLHAGIFVDGKLSSKTTGYSFVTAYSPACILVLSLSLSL